MSKKNRTKAEWAVLLTSQEESGQGVKEWCTANGININSMYNQIAKHHKEQQGRSENRTTKIIKPINEKTISKADNPVTIEWKEINAIPEQQRESIQRGSIYVEIGGMRLAADAGYPVTNLAALCKELRQPC